MLDVNCDVDTLKRVNELGSELLKKRGHNWINPYSFYESSGLVNQFYLGEGGVWLAIDGTFENSLLEVYSESEVIRYSSHNVDNSKQAQSLMALVDMWVEYSEILEDN